MKTACGHKLPLLVSVALFTMATSGCAVGLRSFSLDSTSRTPFFGFELKERKPKSNAPVYNSISQTELDNSRIEPAVQSQSTKTSSLLNLGLRNPFSSRSTDSPMAKTQPTPSSVAIPLSVNQGAFTPIARKTDDSNMDFQ